MCVRVCIFPSTDREIPTEIGFSSSAEDARVSIEGEGPVCVLRARLRDDQGEYKDSDLNLSERLANKDGTFGWCEYYAPAAFCSRALRSR